MSPDEVVDLYLNAIGERDFERARTYLADRRFRYTSPIARYEDADVFIANISRIGPILSRIERRRRFSDGAEVCDILDMTVNMAEVRTHTMAHWARVTGGRIERIEAIYDATEYNRMFDL